MNAAVPDGVEELATLLSVATRIEPELIRAMRLSLLPRLDAGTEADLWFSDLIGPRTPDAVMLAPAVLPDLRARLAAQGDPVLDQVWEVLSHIHAPTLSPALYLEERVTWLAIAGRLDDTDDTLGPALRALVEQSRTGIADWFADAWDRLPPTARATLTAWQLAAVTTAHHGALTPAAKPGNITLNDVARIAGAVPEVPLPIRRYARFLIFGEDRRGQDAILVPDTDPRVVEVEHPDAPPQTVRIPAGRTVRIRTALTGPVRIRTAHGARYDLPSLADKIPDLAVPLSRHVNDHDDFTRRYASYLADEYALFEFFQVNRGRPPYGYHFADYYVEPAIAGPGESIVGATVSVLRARRVLLFGGPGSGKTTFLRYLTFAVADAPRDRRAGRWRGDVPFFLRMNQFAERPLPTPGELVELTAPVLAERQPAGWASELFGSGRAMLLVDGVDELASWRRAEVESWLRQLVGAYPDARYVVTLRPSTVAETWPGEIGFDRFELLPLSGIGLRDLVSRWFAAARAGDTDAGQREWLAERERLLIETLSVHPELRRLAASPLLACVLCAVWRQADGFRYRLREILEQALDLLLDSWDARKGLEAEDELVMSMADKRVLLERLAAPMVRNSELVISLAAAEIRLSRAMMGLRSQGAEPDRVLRHLVERTGLLREDSGDIQFANRVFRDYFAASEFVKAGELGYLIDHADDVSLSDVIFMAAARAREREAGALLRGLLRRADGQKNQEVADRLRLLAAAALDQVDVIDPGVVVAEVRAALESLIPPPTLEAADMLARAGSFVAGLLPGPDDLAGYPHRAEVAARVLRTLATIGTEEAAEKIQAFSRTDKGTVIDELLRAWRQFGHSEDYARTVLSTVDFGDRALEVRNWGMLVLLRHLPGLTALRLVGPIALTDGKGGRPLAEIPNLRSLEIQANDAIRDLTGLRGCGALRVLRVSGYGVLDDLSTIAELDVEELYLDIAPGRGRYSLATLAGAPRLAKLMVRGVPSEREVDTLGELPALRHLVVRNAGPINELVRLRPLGAVRIEVPDIPLGALERVREWLPEAEIMPELRGPSG